MPSPPLALAITGINTDDWDLICWSDVVAEWKVRLGQSLGFEEPSIGITRDEIVVPATHFSDQQSAPSIALVYRGGGYPFPNGRLW